MKLALVRAGPPAFSGRVPGTLEVPLSPEGQDRARKAAASVLALGVAGTIYHPPVGHPAEAARIMASTLEGSRLREATDLVELDLGLWQGLDEEELKKRHPQAFAAFVKDARAVVPPEAEEVDDARERFGKLLSRIRKSHRKDSKLVVVVASEFAFALLVSAATGQEAPADLWRQRLLGDDVRSFEV